MTTRGSVFGVHPAALAVAAYLVAAGALAISARGADAPSPPTGAPKLIPGTLTPQLPALKPQLLGKTPHARGREKGTVFQYAVKLDEPYFHQPVTVKSEVFVPSRPKGAKLPLEVTTPPYGSKLRWKDRHYVPGAIQLGIAIYSDPMLQGMIAGGRVGRGRGRIVHNYQQRFIFGMVAWAKQTHPVDGERVSIWGQYALWAIRHPDVFAVVMADPYGNYAEMIEAQKRSWQWGAGPLGAINWLGIRQWVYMYHSKWVWDHPTSEMPYLLLWPALGSHVGDMGFLSVPATYRALTDTKRAFSGTWGGSWGVGLPATRALVARIRRGQAMPAFTGCSLDGCPGDGRWGADGDRNGQMNGWIMWEPEAVTDAADGFEVTCWLNKSAPARSCTVDVTPRACRKFRAKAGRKFTWRVALLPPQAKAPKGDKPATVAGAPKVIQTGSAEADRWGLVTAQKVRIGTDRVRIRIAPAR